MTVSGTTVTIGGESTTTGTSTTYAYMVGVSSTVFLTITLTASTGFYAKPFSISGTTISAGTEASVTSLTSTTEILIYPISSAARWAVLYLNAAGTSIAASIVSVATTTATLTSVNLIASTTNARTAGAGIVDASKLIYFSSVDSLVNILTDTAGTASAGTATTVAGTGVVTGYYATGNVARFLSTGPNLAYLSVIGYSGSSPTVIDAYGYTITNGFLGQTTPPPFDGSRAPQIFIGAQTLSLSTFSAVATGMRAPIAVGNVLLPRYLRADLEQSLDTAANLAVAGQNGTWSFATTADGPFGLLQLIEGVS